MRRIAVQRGFVGLARDTFVGSKRRPQDRPQYARPRLGRRTIWRGSPDAEVRQRRDYDLPQRVAPTHSPGDPPPAEEPRASLPIGEWLRRQREAAS